MDTITVILQRGGEAFRGLPPLDDFAPQLPHTTIGVFRKHVQPTLDNKLVWAGDLRWLVIPPGGGNPVPVENWKSPLSEHADVDTATVSFILESPTITTPGAVDTGEPRAEPLPKRPRISTFVCNSPPSPFLTVLLCTVMVSCFSLGTVFTSLCRSCECVCRLRSGLFGSSP
jgi:hypothetical protein